MTQAAHVLIVGSGPNADYELNQLDLHLFQRVIGINEAVCDQSCLTDLVVIDPRALEKIGNYLRPDMKILMSYQAMSYLLSPGMNGSMAAEFMRCQVSVRRAVTRALEPGHILAGPGGTLISALDYALRECGAMYATVVGCPFYDQEAPDDRNDLLGAMAGQVHSAIHSRLYEPMQIDWRPDGRVHFDFGGDRAPVAPARG